MPGGIPRWVVPGSRVRETEMSGVGGPRDPRSKKENSERGEGPLRRRCAPFLQMRHLCVLVYDLEGNLLDASEQALRLLGYERGEVAGLALGHLLDPDQIPAALEELQRLRRGGRAAGSGRYRLRRKDRGFVPVDYDASVLTLAEKPCAVLGVAVPVGEAESPAGEGLSMSDPMAGERAVRPEVAREGEERYRRLAENVPDMIWHTDAEGVIEYVNPAIERVLGYTQDEAIGMRNERYFTARSVSDTIRWVVEAVSADPPRSFYMGEVECVRKDGSAVPCEVSVSIVYGDDGEILGFEGITRDLSHRQDAAAFLRLLNRELEDRVKLRTEELHRAYEELNALDRTKDLLVSSIAHEFRSPLSSIRAFSEILTTYPEIPEKEAREFLSIIHSESERLSRLVESVLDLSRIRIGHVVWKDGPIHLGELVGRVVDGARPLIEAGAHALRVDVPPNLPCVRADRDRVHQVLLNLLQNAIKFSPAGRPIRIHAEEVEGKPEDDVPAWVRLAVRDHGIGIPASDLRAIFEPFYQGSSEPRRDYPGGAGLGLSISREIVEHYGGRLWAESHPGAGSTFFFTLPAAPLPETGLPPSLS